MNFSTVDGLLIFAHLRKCAGTSVIHAASKAGIRLPPRHRNGHPAGSDGHAIPNLARMTSDEIAAILGRLAGSGVELTSIEWDFPTFALFPTDLGLRFFTILRDPVERFLSNYAYDVVSGFTASRTVLDYLGEGGIWTHGNYYTRFFGGLSANDTVGQEDVDAVLNLLLRHFHFALMTDDLDGFLAEEVELSIGRLRRSNRVGRLRKFLSRTSLKVTDDAIQRIEAANTLDRGLYTALQRVRALRGSRSSSNGHIRP